MKRNSCEDLVGSQKWDGVWQESDIPEPIDPTCERLDSHRDRQYHKLFCKLFAGMSGKKLLEAGCANSRWLPYFALRHGLQVEGLDYSATGCQQARAILERAGVDGTIHQRDMFDCPDLAERYDVVISFGLVEHFSSTSSALAALGKLLRPGGMLVTVVPQVRGLPGLLLRRINRQSYDEHIPLPPKVLAEAIQAAGLANLDSRYLLTLNLSALSLALVQRKKAWWVKPVWNVFDLTTNCVSRLIRAGLPEMPNAFTSPYVVNIAMRPISNPRSNNSKEKI